MLAWPSCPRFATSLARARLAGFDAVVPDFLELLVEELFLARALALNPRLIIARMLTPSVRRRWLYGSLVVLKLALIVVLLRGMIGFFPLEVIPLTTGILLFSASILLEACWLVLRPEVNENDLK